MVNSQKRIPQILDWLHKSWIFNIDILYLNVFFLCASSRFSGNKNAPKFNFTDKFLVRDILYLSYFSDVILLIQPMIFFRYSPWSRESHIIAWATVTSWSYCYFTLQQRRTDLSSKILNSIASGLWALQVL